jgi:hypothetical protein
MKTAVKTTLITQKNKSYKQGIIEIDTEQNQLILKTTVGTIPLLPFIMKKEKTLSSTTYNETEFPQLDGNTITIHDATAQIPSTEDQQTITDAITKPHQALRSQIETEIAKAEKNLKDALETRAESLDYLVELKENPRRTLFQTDPELLANTENPTEEATKKQKTKIETAISNLRTNLTAMTKNGQLNQETQDTFTRVAIAIGLAQDAQFQQNETEKQNANRLLQTMGFTTQTNQAEIRTIKQNTETQTIQLIAKTHLALVDSKAGTTKCPKCKKYIKPNQSCSSCNPPASLI